MEQGIKKLSMAEIVAKAADPIAAIKSLGLILTKSQMIGPTDRVEQGESLALVCVTTGMDPLELSRNYQLSFGRLEKKIDSAVADFLAKGGKIEWLDDGSDGVQARAKFSIAGDSVTATCMYEEAVKAGWTKNKKWETERPTMLRARVKKRGVLALAPEIFCGEPDDSGGDMTALPQAEPVKMAAAAQSAAEQSKAHAPNPAAPPTSTPAPAPAAPATTKLPELTDDLQWAGCRLTARSNSSPRRTPRPSSRSPMRSRASWPSSRRREAGSEDHRQGSGWMEPGAPSRSN